MTIYRHGTYAKRAKNGIKVFSLIKSKFLLRTLNSILKDLFYFLNLFFDIFISFVIYQSFFKYLPKDSDFIREIFCNFLCGSKSCKETVKLYLSIALSENDLLSISNIEYLHKKFYFAKKQAFRGKYLLLHKGPLSEFIIYLNNLDIRCQKLTI